MNDFTAQFLRDVAGHKMTVIRDEVNYRHIRFQEPGTYNMMFDLVTWNGHLCFCGGMGGMGTYVFQRLPDMFEFFRAGGNGLYSIDLRYWAQKVQAQCRRGEITEFSWEKFKAEVIDWVHQLKGNYNPNLMEAIEEDLFDRYEGESEDVVMSALRDFDHDGFEFVDWESRCHEYTFRFKWCCHALRWAIDLYDKRESTDPDDNSARVDRMDKAFGHKP